MQYLLPLEEYQFTLSQYDVNSEVFSCSVLHARNISCRNKSSNMISNGLSQQWSTNETAGTKFMSLFSWRFLFLRRYISYSTDFKYQNLTIKLQQGMLKIWSHYFFLSKTVQCFDILDVAEVPSRVQLKYPNIGKYIWFSHTLLCVHFKHIIYKSGMEWSMSFFTMLLPIHLTIWS